MELCFDTSFRSLRSLKKDRNMKWNEPQLTIFSGVSISLRVGLEMEIEAPVHIVPATAVKL